MESEGRRKEIQRNREGRRLEEGRYERETSRRGRGWNGTEEVQNLTVTSSDCHQIGKTIQHLGLRFPAVLPPICRPFPSLHPAGIGLTVPRLTLNLTPLQCSVSTSYCLSISSHLASLLCLREGCKVL